MLAAGMAGAAAAVEIVSGQASHTDSSLRC